MVRDTMTEARPIRTDEAETFLGLLCDVFGLDYQRAHRVFFAEPMFDLQRKWAYFENGRMLSILTTVPLEFGWGRAIGIAGVATVIERRGEGLASRLLDKVLKASERAGETGALLFARETELYARSGFEVADEVVRGRIASLPEEKPPQVVDFDRVETLYESWREQSPNRLRRTPRRWDYWRWNLRVCSEFADGYLCHEGAVVRECVFTPPAQEWRLPIEAEWVGLQTVAESLQVPVDSPAHELYLMARGVPGTPQMFMTDQF